MEILESLGGGASQEVGYQGWALRCCSLALLPVHSLLPSCGRNVATMPFLPATYLLCSDGWYPLNYNKYLS